MPLKNWSNVPGNNVSAPPFGAPESSTKIKDYNDIARQIMADTRNLASAVTVAAAATTDLGAVDETILTLTNATGAEITVTAFGTVSAGIYKLVTFSGASTINVTHNATSLILLGGASRTTVAGDCGLYVSLGGGNWKEYFFSPITAASYQPLSSTLTTLANQDATGSSLVGYTPSGTGAAATTVQAKLREQYSDKDFGSVGDGATNDTTALTNFFNSAIANPGVPHRIRKLTFAITAQLPTLNASNIIIECPGADLHDVGSLFNGAVIKWIGAAGGTMQEISAVSGASNQRIANLRINGLAYDCNSLAAKGVVIKSVFNSDFQLGVANATTDGLTLDVVASLGEARDLQRNRIRYVSRQIEAPDGVGLRLKGDTGANVSMNDLWMDSAHKNIASIVSENADNNDWWYIRTNRVTGGTASEAISWLGGATEPESTREERIHFLSSNLLSQAYGTPTYAVPAKKIRIFTLDTGNGTPNPTVQTGASVYWNRADTPFGDTPWETATPTPTATTGTFTTVSATRRHMKRGKICFVQAVITITTNGTAAGEISLPLPFAEGASTAWIFAGKETAVTGVMQMGIIGGGSSAILITGTDGLYSGGDGRSITINGFYEIA